MKHIDLILTDIAREHLSIETLETRNSDGLDFHDVSVCRVRDALAATYAAGRQSFPGLLEAAELVVSRWERGDLAGAVRMLAEAVEVAKAA